MRSRLSAREYLTSSVRRLDRRFSERAATGFRSRLGKSRERGRGRNREAVSNFEVRFAPPSIFDDAFLHF